MLFRAETGVICAIIPVFYMDAWRQAIRLNISEIIRVALHYCAPKIKISKIKPFSTESFLKLIDYLIFLSRYVLK